MVQLRTLFTKYYRERRRCNYQLARALTISQGMRRVHEERRLLKYSNVELYNVVADVAKYKEFVPWCKRSVITKGPTFNAINNATNGLSMVADLSVGFDVFNETYTSVVQLQPHSSVVATSQDTKLLDFLHTEWKFIPSASDPNLACWITFRVEFQFKSSLYSNISAMFMKEVTTNMVRAFEVRCRQVYGKRGGN